MAGSLTQSIESAARLIVDSEHLVALVGAGLSTEKRHTHLPGPRRALDSSRRAKYAWIPAVPG
jgi:hypothetical protein